MSKTKRAKQWPPIYRAKNRSGQFSFQVDLGQVDGKRKRMTYPTKPEAETAAEAFRIERENNGAAALSLPDEVRLDAAKAQRILSPHGVSIFEAARHYEKHVLAYKSAPPVGEIVKRYIDEASQKPTARHAQRFGKSVGALLPMTLAMFD